MQYKKTHAREGRGKGNGCNENWYNSPLWVNMHENKKKSSNDIDIDTESKIKETTKSLYGLAY